MSPSVKTLTAVFLAVLYGMVGLTGQVLHYLVEDACLALRQIDISASGGYFHAHYPDNHVHFHHHHHQDDASDSQDSKLADQEHSSRLRYYEEFHQQHACPLLTVVQTLKLGSGGMIVPRFELKAHRTSPSELCICHDFKLAFHHLARGPPITA